MLDVRDDGGGGVLLAVKAVPGAKRDQVAGLLGNRLKVRVAAPPEDGRANRAICELLAAELGLKPKQVRVLQGLSSAEKTVQIDGTSLETVRARWQ
jgi:uncharacterized protein (TIGR00251 family)